MQKMVQRLRRIFKICKDSKVPPHRMPRVVVLGWCLAKLRESQLMAMRDFFKMHEKKKTSGDDDAE